MAWIRQVSPTPKKMGNFVVCIELVRGEVPDEINNPQFEVIDSTQPGPFGGIWWVAEVTPELFNEYPFPGFYEKRFGTI